MTRKLIHQFSAIKHRKVSSTSLFNVRYGPNETIPDYVARYYDTTIKRKIEKLIQDEKLRGNVKGKHGEERRRPMESTKVIKDDTNGDHKERHTLNTISGGFAGGGESSYSQKSPSRLVLAKEKASVLPEEQFMKQKSRVNSLEAGDQNTSYFHRVVKAKAAKSRILSITSATGD
ncbi:hypothetical protein MTR_6g045443 [Medicago truncatula]|uniref:Uncharacterized protein n=1 Tax=Medicago truncatula TaxID=3880 RepID=A0A072U8P5_MEDTR|nr:hypothetical protein MTR_6g045443 [Medicago truncatula]